MKSPGGPETFPVRPGFLLGHQGGWDEMLLVVGPLLIVGLLLWLANKRVSAQLDESKTGTAGSADRQSSRSSTGSKQASRDRRQRGQ